MATGGDDVGYQINKTVDESLEATRRIKNMAIETTDVAIRTAEELDHQGNKLENIEKQLDNINEDMKQADKTLNQMDKFLGLFRMPKFGKKKSKVKPSDDPFSKQEVYEDKMDRVAAGRAANGVASASASQMPSGRIIQRIANDDREDEMDENLQAVDSILGNLKNMALDMGNEIDVQNKRIDRLTTKTEIVDMKVHEADKRIRKQLWAKRQEATSDNYLIHN